MCKRKINILLYYYEVAIDPIAIMSCLRSSDSLNQQSVSLNSLLCTHFSECAFIFHFPLMVSPECCLMLLLWFFPHLLMCLYLKREIFHYSNFIRRGVSVFYSTHWYKWHEQINKNTCQYTVIRLNSTTNQWWKKHYLLKYK